MPNRPEDKLAHGDLTAFSFSPNLQWLTDDASHLNRNKWFALQAMKLGRDASAFRKRLDTHAQFARSGTARCIPESSRRMNANRVAALLRELASELERDRVTSRSSDDWIDQYHSPLGKRLHLDLVRAGKLKGYKTDRVHVYVKRSDLNAYLEKHPARRKVAAAPQLSDEVKSDPVEMAARLRGKLGLVKTRQA